MIIQLLKGLEAVEVKIERGRVIKNEVGNPPCADVLRVDYDYILEYPGTMGLRD